MVDILLIFLSSSLSRLLACLIRTCQAKCVHRRVQVRLVPVHRRRVCIYASLSAVSTFLCTLYDVVTVVSRAVGLNLRLISMVNHLPWELHGPANLKEKNSKERGGKSRKFVRDDSSNTMHPHTLVFGATNSANEFRVNEISTFCCPIFRNTGNCIYVAETLLCICFVLLRSE